MSQGSDFRGRIDRRLSLIFGILFFVVLLVGGISLYLARSIFLSTEEIRRESARIDLVDQMHSTVHHFVSAVQRAILRGSTTRDAEGETYLQLLHALLDRYQKEGIGEKEVGEEIRQMVADFASFFSSLGRVRDPGDLKVLSDAERRIRELAHRLSAAHRARMEQLVEESRWRMQLILGLYATFILVGGVLIVGSSFYFSRTIARPLRWLSQAASRIAQGNLREEVPVTSKDEVGQLSHAFNVMTDRLREHEERLKGLATLEERERIAQELHDSLAQDLALLHLKIIEAEQNLAPEGSPAAKDILQEMRKIADGAYEDVRQAIFGLRTMVSKGLGLIPTLTEYLHDFSELRKIPVDFKIDGANVFRFPPQVEIQLIRIIHEALTNVFKHAEAKRSVVQFVRDGEFGKVIIEDDGKGFMLEEVLGKGLRFGLQTMRERAEGVNGKLIIETAPGKGTKVIVCLPLAGSNHDADSSAPGR